MGRSQWNCVGCDWVLMTLTRYNVVVVGDRNEIDLTLLQKMKKVLEGFLLAFTTIFR